MRGSRVPTSLPTVPEVHHWPLLQALHCVGLRSQDACRWQGGNKISTRRFGSIVIAGSTDISGISYSGGSTGSMGSSGIIGSDGSTGILSFSGICGSGNGGNATASTEDVGVAAST